MLGRLRAWASFLAGATALRAAINTFEGANITAGHAARILGLALETSSWPKAEGNRVRGMVDQARLIDGDFGVAGPPRPTLILDRFDGSPRFDVSADEYRWAMTQHRRPDELDHHDLGAHSTHTLRLYGGEEMWISDIRGKDGAADPDVTLRFKNVSLCGPLSTLQSFADVMSGLLVETLVRRDEIERYDTELVARRVPIDGPRARLRGRPHVDGEP